MVTVGGPVWRAPVSVARLTRYLLCRARLTTRGHFVPLLHAAAQRGELNDGVEVDTAAFVVQAVTGQLGQFLARRLGLPPGLPDPAAFACDEVERAFDQVIDVLRNGLAQQRTSRPVYRG